MVILTEKQITKLKKQLIEQKNGLTDNKQTKENEITSHASLRDSIDELSTVDNHPADLATELYDREKDLALKTHTEDVLSEVEAALERIENGTYGVCATCNEEIPYDRLCAIPHTTFCIEHSQPKTVPTDRPVEEDTILPAVDNSFSNREPNDSLQDDEDSFRLVASYGNSDTPSDFEGDYDHYNDLYDDDEDQMFSELEELYVSETEFLDGQISQEYIDKARKYDYLE